MSKIVMCPKCGHLVVSSRDIVGSGWVVCECDKRLIAAARETIDMVKDLYSSERTIPILREGEIDFFPKEQK